MHLFLAFSSFALGVILGGTIVHIVHKFSFKREYDLWKPD